MCVNHKEINILTLGCSHACKYHFTQNHKNYVDATLHLGDFYWAPSDKVVGLKDSSFNSIKIKHLEATAPPEVAYLVGDLGVSGTWE